MGEVEWNVAKLVDAPSVIQREIKPFNLDHARIFIQVIKGDRLESLCTLGIAVGLRQAEILGLSWSDIDLQERQITIRTTLQRIEGEYRFLEPKSARSRRTLVLPEIAIDALNRHRGQQLGAKLKAGERCHSSDLVVTSRNGTPINRHNLTRDYKSLLKRAGLPELRFHDLRHTAASLFCAQNVQPRDLMEILGHSQISLTMNTYTHVMYPAMQEAASRMDSILTG